jgi:hypothetical protein
MKRGRDDESLRNELDFYSPEELEDMELGVDPELVQLSDWELDEAIETMKQIGEENPNWSRQIKSHTEERLRRNSPLVQAPEKPRCPECRHVNETRWPWYENCGYGGPEEACISKRPKGRSVRRHRITVKL